MFSTTFMDPDELIANTSTNAHHSRICTTIIVRDCFFELAVILGPIFPLMFMEISD